MQQDEKAEGALYRAIERITANDKPEPFNGKLLGLVIPHRTLTPGECLDMWAPVNLDSWPIDCEWPIGLISSCCNAN